MEYIKGFTFGWGAKRGDFNKEEARQSLKLMKERTASNYVIFALAATQETAFSTKVIYRGQHMVTDQELEEMIDYARTLDLKVMLKPTVNPADGIWRAHINFFDIDVPCERNGVNGLEVIQTINYIMLGLPKGKKQKC